MSRRFEKPQTGNPHQLTIKQHVWPAASIARFTNQRGTVCLLQKTNNITRWAKPGDDIFCAHRIWDQRAEAGYMRQIEDAFQKLAARVAVGKVMKFDASEKAKIDYFFSLWCMRSSYKNAVGEDVHLNAVTGHDWTKDQEERFEKTFHYFLRKDGKLPARMINGMRIQRGIDDYVSQLCDINWAIVRAQHGNFLVPDRPAHLCIPITPTICLIAGEKSGIIVQEDVGFLNGILREASQDYFFARDLTCCP